MAREDNLKPFTSEHQPQNRRSRKGSPNRATVYKKILEAKTRVVMPDGSKKLLTIYEQIALGQAKSAMEGNTSAWKEIQDSLHGKIADKQELTGKDGGPLEVATFQITTRRSDDE